MVNKTILMAIIIEMPVLSQGHLRLLGKIYCLQELKCGHHKNGWFI